MAHRSLAMNFRLSRIYTVALLLGLANAGTFSVKRNVDIGTTALTSAIKVTSAIALTSCSLLCNGTSNCISAAYNIKNLSCYTLSKTLSVGIIANSDWVYLESQCIAPNSGQEDCCMGTPNTGCYNRHTQTYKDCQEAFERGERKCGLFYLRQTTHYRRVRAWCDFDSVSGWTVIQRRLDGSVNFYRPWASYVDGFGFLTGEYWFGLENIYFITRENIKLSIYLEAWDGEIMTANYSQFYIDGADVNYILRVSGYSGTAGDSLGSATCENSNGRPFTALDRDNDADTRNCAVTFTGAWWYNSCHCSNLNGQYYVGGTTTSFATGTSWKTWKGHYYSYKMIVMRVGR